MVEDAEHRWRGGAKQSEPQHGFFGGDLAVFTLVSVAFVSNTCQTFLSLGCLEMPANAFGSLAHVSYPRNHAIVRQSEHGGNGLSFDLEPISKQIQRSTKQQQQQHTIIVFLRPHHPASLMDQRLCFGCRKMRNLRRRHTQTTSPPREQRFRSLVVFLSFAEERSFFSGYLLGCYQEKEFVNQPARTPPTNDEETKRSCEA